MSRSRHALNKRSLNRRKPSKRKLQWAKDLTPLCPPLARGDTEGGVFKDPTTGMEFIFVKGGCYQMGDSNGDVDSKEVYFVSKEEGFEILEQEKLRKNGKPFHHDDKPVHKVCVDDFYIGKYEVTQGQWKERMENNPSSFKDCGDNCPVESVSYNDAQKFIQKLNSRTGKRYRLPTEAEWEYAARSRGKKEKWAGTSNEYELGEYAWYGDNSGSKTHPVGQKKPNGLGIYDMSGNVWEWVQDRYDENYYKNSPRNNPQGPNSGQYRVLRGGSWYIIPRNFRATSRFWFEPSTRSYGYGFRLVRTP
ncbi:MAG: formylglycine-generating enzyme family protein [Thermodesulfovibrio sp.]|nr:formylglycine-generating enzyme family protein [Thermodesulfovibrio sp.]